MSEEIHFVNAPITEAVFYIQTVLPTDFDYKSFESVYTSFEKEFPTKEVSLQYETSIQVDKEKDPVYGTKGGANGFFFKSIDGKSVIQFRTDGFTFNKLKPYDSWETFSGDAKKFWEIYKSVAKPVKINRVGLRYINRLDIPLPIKDFKEYIKTVPEIASDVPQDLVDFFMRLVIPQPDDTSNVAIITETIDKKANLSENILPFIFDIEVFRILNTKSDDPKLLGIFETLRAYKNKIFVNSITDKMKDLIS